MDRKRVHPTLELGSKHSVDHPVALDAALPPEGIRHNIEAEMALPSGPMARMPLVLVGFVDELDAFRRESLRQLSCDEVANAHFIGLRRPDLLRQ